jgi:hypothetical protein
MRRDCPFASRQDRSEEHLQVARCGAGQPEDAAVETNELPASDHAPNGAVSEGRPPKVRGRAQTMLRGCACIESCSLVMSRSGRRHDAILPTGCDTLPARPPFFVIEAFPANVSITKNGIREWW